MSIYNLCNKKDLRSMNIFFSCVLGAFEYNNEYVVLIDEKHICFLQTEDELQRFIRNINWDNAQATFLISHLCKIFCLPLPLPPKRATIILRTRRQTKN